MKDPGSYSIGGTQKWQELFEVKQHTIKPTKFDKVKEAVGLGFAYDKYEWHLVDRKANKIVGKYQNAGYAIKQAKYRYKKTINKIDKILLG